MILLKKVRTNISILKVGFSFSSRISSFWAKTKSSSQNLSFGSRLIIKCWLTDILMNFRNIKAIWRQKTNIAKRLKKALWCGSWNKKSYHFWHRGTMHRGRRASKKLRRSGMPHAATWRWTIKSTEWSRKITNTLAMIKLINYLRTSRGKTSSMIVHCYKEPTPDVSSPKINSRQIIKS